MSILVHYSTDYLFYLSISPFYFSTRNSHIILISLSFLTRIYSQLSSLFYSYCIFVTHNLNTRHFFFLSICQIKLFTLVKHSVMFIHDSQSRCFHQFKHIVSYHHNSMSFSFSMRQVLTVPLHFSGYM